MIPSIASALDLSASRSESDPGVALASRPRATTAAASLLRGISDSRAPRKRRLSRRETRWTTSGGSPGPGGAGSSAGTWPSGSVGAWRGLRLQGSPSPPPAPPRRRRARPERERRREEREEGGPSAPAAAAAVKREALDELGAAPTPARSNAFTSLPSECSSRHRGSRRRSSSLRRSSSVRTPSAPRRTATSRSEQPAGQAERKRMPGART